MKHAILKPMSAKHLEHEIQETPAEEKREHSKGKKPCDCKCPGKLGAHLSGVIAEGRRQYG